MLVVYNFNCPWLGTWILWRYLLQHNWVRNYSRDCLWRICRFCFTMACDDTCGRHKTCCAHGVLFNSFNTLELVAATRLGEIFFLRLLLPHILLPVHDSLQQHMRQTQTVLCSWCDIQLIHAQRHSGSRAEDD